jgi:hypothetical protein
MKATLEFNLPEEQEEFQLATNAVKWMSFAHQFEQYLRAEYKYNEDKYNEDQYKTLVEIRETFYELLNEEGLSL